MTQKPIFRLLLGFDFGMKRIGVAIGQTITHEARPLATLMAKSGVPDWKQLDDMIKKWRPDALVVGIPLNMDGSTQPLTERAHDFAENLASHYALPVYTTDERLTTKAARTQLFDEGGYRALNDGQVDQVAAQLILQNWFKEFLA